MSLAAVVALLGFLLVTAVVSGRAERQKGAPRRGELVDVIRSRQALVEDLDAAVRELRADIVAANRREARRSTSERLLNAATEQLAVQAGTVALSGPGLVVTLENSKRTAPSPTEAGAYVIHDTDVQLVVNALLAGGAEAVAINDSRVVATTPIRSAGDTVVVNFRPLTPPYRIAAIGADPSKFDSSQIAARFKQWTRLFGLGFRVDQRTRVTVPPYTGRVAITAARPLSEPPSSRVR